MQKTTHDSRFLVLKYSFLRVVKTFQSKNICKNQHSAIHKTTWLALSFYAVEQHFNHGTQAPDFSVTRAGCCKRSTFSIMSFSRISKLRSVESCPDVSQRCNDCSLRQSPISFAHKAFWCKIRSQKLANSACVNSSRRISAQSESNLTPDCLRSLVRFPQIFQSFTLTKLDRLSTVDLHTRLYRTSNKLSSG